MRQKRPTIGEMKKLQGSLEWHKKRLEGVKKSLDSASALNRQLERDYRDMHGTVKASMDGLVKSQEALQDLLTLLDAIQPFAKEREPWEKIRANANAAKRAVVQLVRMLR